jgi:hypothetical protein
MQQYQLSPHVFLELFPDDAVMLVADRNIMVKINHAAARIYQLASSAANDRTFTRNDLLDFLMDNFDVSKTEAELQLRSLLCFGLRYGVVYKRISP